MFIEPFAEYTYSTDRDAYRLYAGKKLLGEYDAVVLAAPLEASNITLSVRRTQTCQSTKLD
jgi:hypothetical protein